MNTRFVKTLSDDEKKVNEICYYYNNVEIDLETLKLIEDTGLVESWEMSEELIGEDGRTDILGFSLLPFIINFTTGDHMVVYM